MSSFKEAVAQWSHSANSNYFVKDDENDAPDAKNLSDDDVHCGDHDCYDDVLCHHDGICGDDARKLNHDDERDYHGATDDGYYEH